MDQNVRNRLNEIRQKQLESEQNPQASEPSPASGHTSPKIAALGGLAAGFILAWLMNSFLPTENADLTARESHLVIHENEIREANRLIEQLNDRVDLLTDSISSLESGLTQKIESIERNKSDENITSADRETIEPENELPAPAMADSQASGVNAGPATGETVFTPTHVVKTRLNLRTSTSLDDAPIGVLSSGTKVEYIDEANGWYYINTEEFGNGWCASRYLSPLSSP